MGSPDIKWFRPGFPPLDSLVRITETIRIQGHQLPIGLTGIVGEGAYCSAIIDYTCECPIQFNKDDLPETLGVPWGVLEFAVQ